MNENGWQRWFAWHPVRVNDGISWKGGTRSVDIIQRLLGIRWLCVIERRAIDIPDYLWRRTDRLWDYRVIPDYEG